MIIDVKIEPFEDFLDALVKQIKGYKVAIANKEIDAQLISPFFFIEKRSDEVSNYLCKDGKYLAEEFITDIEQKAAPWIGKSWEIGCTLANQHLQKWDKNILFQVVISRDPEKKYNDYINCCPRFKHSMRGLCGYIAQGKYVIEQLRKNEIDLSEIDGHLGNSIKRQKKELDDLNKQKENLSRELSKQREEEERLSSEFEKRIEEKENKINELGEKIEELEPEYERISDCINNKDKIIEEKQKKIEELEEKIGKLKQENEEFSDGCSQKELKLQQLNVKIKGLEKEKNELENKTNSLEDDVKELERNKEEIEASINELSKEGNKLKEIKDNLNDKIVDLDKRYIKNIKVMERLLHLSKATSNRYHEIVDALRWGYRREAINDNIKMSMFWATCLDDIYKAITDEEIKRAEGEMNSLNYEEIVECLVTVGEIIKDNLPRCDMLTIKAHDLKDEEEVRAISKSQAKEILDLYRKEDERGLNNKLEEIMTELKGLNIGNPHIRDMFVTSIINKLNSENSKLAMTMIVDSLKEYIKKYGSRY